MIERILETTIQERLWQGKAIILFGARQVGKTTMLKKMLQGRDDVLRLNGDEQDVRNLFENASSTLLNTIIGKKKIVVIDEAQRITNIGLGIKLITDNISGVQVVATGSSSFDLSKQDKTSHSRAGNWNIGCTRSPLASLWSTMDCSMRKGSCHTALIYGSYPDVINNAGDERMVLSELAK